MAVIALYWHDDEEIVKATKLALTTSSGRYHQTVLLVGLTHGQVDAVAEGIGGHAISVGQLVARRLIEQAPRSRPIAAGEALRQLLSERQSHPLLLDHLEMLFEPSLCIDPLALLKQVSRDKPIIVVWPGKLDGEDLVYAEPGHPEYRRDSAKDLMVVAANEQSTTA